MQLLAVIIGSVEEAVKASQEYLNIRTGAAQQDQIEGEDWEHIVGTGTAAAYAFQLNPYNSVVLWFVLSIPNKIFSRYSLLEKSVYDSHLLM